MRLTLSEELGLERHFYRREKFKENRTRALAEWRQLVA